jgi:glucose dehydrogenase
MRILSFLLLLVVGLGMAVPGVYLAALGGSFYYAVAGILILACAFLVLRRRSSGIYLFWLVLLATLVWSLWEVGLDGWALMPRRRSRARCQRATVSWPRWCCWWVLAGSWAHPC